MVTKKDYEDAIKKIREAFYSSICDEWALEQIAVNLDFLSSLINEHFEEKPETNLEHYYEDLLKEKGDYGFANGKVKSCLGMSCSDCKFYTPDIKSCCKVEKIKWLSSPYKEYKEQTYKLTQFEYDLLRTNNMSHDLRLKDFAIYENLREIGYFKDVNFDLTIDEILENCEIKGE